HHGDGKLLGKPGSWQRARTLERMATMATEMQPIFNRFFHADDFSEDGAVQQGVMSHAAKKLMAWFREQDPALQTLYGSGGAYNLPGGGLDRPRGRIYLMKLMLECAQVPRRTQLHLDRCLTSRACETTCPSGVEYGKLVDIGRDIVEAKVERKPMDRFRRWFL